MNISITKKAILYCLLLLLYTSSLKSQLYINEFMASNATAVQDPDLNLFSDWLELYNAGGVSVDLSNYYLSDNLSDSVKWQIPGGTTIPAGGFLVFWADATNSGLHTNFKLSSVGEEIGLFDTTGVIVDSIIYSAQRTDISMGRKPDGSSSWVLFSDFTLGTTNNSISYAGISLSPQYSIPGGFYSSSQSLVLSSPFGVGEIHFTIDGAEPSVSSPLYTVPISINTTTVIRAITFENGKLQSNIINQSFFINEPAQTLPVISISTAPYNFWDADSGIYVNYNEDWEKPIGIEFFEPGGIQGFMSNAGIAIYGSATRGAAQKAFAINFSTKYGNKEINYKIFENIDRKKFGSFVLRNGGNTWFGAETVFNPVLFNDAIQHTIFVGQMDVDLMPFRATSVYINGTYWGILNIREKPNEEYVEAHYGFSEDSIDMIKLGKNMPNELIAGDSMHFYNLVEYMKTHDMSQSTSFDYIKTQMDVTEFINYQVAELYTGNFDWPDNNTKLWRPQTPDGKWRWMLYDFDFGFSGHAWGGSAYGKWMGYMRNSYLDALNPNINEWSTIVMRKLNENPDFIKLFAQSMANYINITFDPTRVIDIIDGVQNNASTEMERHIAKWSGDGGINSMTQWNTALDRMRTFAQLRPNMLFSYTKNQYNLWPASLSVTTNYPEGGKIFINDLTIPNSDFSGNYFKDIPINLNVQTNPGYVFKGWEYKGNIITKVNLVDLNSQWKYLDDGSNQGTAWKETSFNDASWATGNAEFGYGEGDESTVVDYGTDPNNKYITTYFRKKFTVTDLNKLEELYFKLYYDDGLIIYLNGVLSAKINMPSSYDYQTVASGGTDNAFKEYILNSTNNLIEGENVIAVEVHQAQINSSDLSFNLELVSKFSTPGDSGNIANTNYTYDLKGDAQFKALFEKKYDLYINEVCSYNLNIVKDEFNEADDWIEIYNAADSAIDIGGLFISDNIKQPSLWQIPTTDPLHTTIQPNNFILLWADKTPAQGVNHLGFGLSSSGEQIGLFDIGSNNIVAIIDSFSFDSIGPNRSFGRFPDAAPYLQSFDLATPTANNNDTIILPPNNNIEELISNNNILIYPNPANNFINISIPNKENSHLYHLKIFTLTGMLIDESILSNNLQTLDISPYKSGIYLLFINIDNTIITRKLIKQ